MVEISLSGSGEGPGRAIARGYSTTRKLAIGTSIRSPRVDGCLAVMGARQRLVCEMSPGADNHRGRIPTLTVALDLRCLHGDERGPRLGAVRAIGEQTKKRERSG